MQVNLQTIEKRVETKDGSLDIQEIFPTIQGEGPFVGIPSIFVRLAGCNAQCEACDTDYTSKRKVYSVEELMSTVKLSRIAHFKDHKRKPLIVITGGEPFRQSLGKSILGLIDSHYPVQIETNGSLYDDSMDYYCLWDEDITIVCSPKSGKVDKKLEQYIDSYKYVIQHGKVDPDDGLPTDVLMTGIKPARPGKDFIGDIYLQPCDEKDPERNALSMKAAVDSCMKYGYRLCLQTHKIAGLP